MSGKINCPLVLVNAKINWRLDLVDEVQLLRSLFLGCGLCQASSNIQLAINLLQDYALCRKRSKFL